MMFELPEAKRVRRQDLHDSSSDDDSADDNVDSAIRARLNERLSGMFSLDLGTDSLGKKPANGDPAAAKADDQGQPDDAAAGGPPPAAVEEAFEFRLFSTGETTKVVLAPEDDGLKGGEEGGIASARPVSFYVRGELSPEEREWFRNATVSYEDLVKAAGQRAWGLEVPWKVTRVTVKPGKGTDTAVEVRVSKGSAEHVEADSGKRKRPGKKRRIALRTKDKARKAKQEELGKKKVEKEEHLKEKKKRLNREKKLKRRQKEREKKQATKSETGVEEVASPIHSDGTE